MKPKQILWFFYEGNDYQDLYYENKVLFLRNYLENKSNFNNLMFQKKIIEKEINSYFNSELIGYLKKVNDDKDNKSIFSIIKLQKVRLYLKLNQVFKDVDVVENEHLIQIKSNLEHVYKVANSTVDSWGGKIYVIYLPEFERFNNKNYEPLINKASLKKILKKYNIEFIDMHKIVFKDTLDPISFFPFREKGHYTVEGYKQIALDLFKYFNN